MSATGTRPPLFDPDRNFDRVPGPHPDGRARFPRRRSRPRRSGLRPLLIVLGVAVVAVLLLTLLPRDGDPPPAPPPDDAQDQVADAAAPDAEAEPDVAAEPAPGAEQGDQPAPAVPVAPPGGGADLQAASAFAAQFAHDYLNWDAGSPEVRQRKLAAYLAPDVDPQLGWDGTGVQVAVLTIPVHAEETDGGAEVVVAAEVTGADAPRWVHLAVPLGRDDQGRWAVTAAPAFVPRPPPGTPAAPDVGEVDEALTETLRPAVEQLMTAFAEQREVVVDGVTAPGARIRGLGGQVVLTEVTGLAVRRDDAGAVAVASVRWTDEVTGSALTQSYGLALIEADGGWLVEAVTATR